jgi:hypothetical protein
MARGALPGVIGSAAETGVIPAGFESAAISASLFIFGSGTEGSAFEREESLAASTETLAGRSVTAFIASPLCGKG